MGEQISRGAIFSDRIDIAKPGGGLGSRPLRGGLPSHTPEVQNSSADGEVRSNTSQEPPKRPVYESSAVDRNNGHIVVKLAGDESRQFGLSEPVIIYERKP